MPLADLLARWRADPETGPNIAAWRTLVARKPSLGGFPRDLPLEISIGLKARGIVSLFSHQLAAWRQVRAGKHIVLATGTASGKTLAYNLPILARLVEEPAARALYLFPTKALAQDQLQQLVTLQATLPGGGSDHDGDTPPRERSGIRRNARLLLSNPDMLHTGILPHHANWSEFFESLRYVVVDELHAYRGVFGSHVANVIRRLKRLAAFHGSRPQFLLASATIGNAQELAEQLIEEPVSLIDSDGSGAGERHFLLFNPPVVDADLGLRRSSLLEAVRLAGDALRDGLQGVVFGRTRRTVEMILSYLQATEAVVARAPGSAGPSVSAGTAQATCQRIDGPSRPD
jgi:DEAD/DEAH box helicase domain-containing protein